MSIRNTLKEREEARNSNTGGSSINEGLPEGVTRYVKLGQELKNGKQFVMLADPDAWYFYYVHEDAVYGGPTHIQKHTCLHSPRRTGESFQSYVKKNGTACISCKANVKRKLYFMVPVYDLEYGTWRVLDLKEFHANNIIGDYDKLEKAAKKFDKAYKLVGDVFEIAKSDKTYSISSGDADVPDGIDEFLTMDLPYEELAYFRDTDDIRELIRAADDTIDKSVLDEPSNKVASGQPVDGPIDISDDDLPY